ncbi:hypothetical protein E2C01_099556 [Portunus trituberculatus]|uniref:Uncharacterized protein n=1 Tax=Portunus trituberculatus TaxID=210409 RepID=A0A5B7KFA0_PORTR|nr:hypothetical protein [Portunus trituberculatus]
MSASRSAPSRPCPALRGRVCVEISVGWVCVSVGGCGLVGRSGDVL